MRTTLKEGGLTTNVSVYCEGVTPLMMDPMPKATLEAIRTKSRQQIVTDRTTRDEASRKIYRSPDDRIALPREMFIACLVSAGRQVKLGAMQKVSTKDDTTLFSFLSVNDEWLYLVYADEEGNLHQISDEGWVDDMRAGALPKDQTRIAIVRPRFDKWGFVAHMTLKENVANEGILKQLLEKAGTICGLGAFRPNCRGPFGQFQVAGYKAEVMKEKAAEPRVKVKFD